MVRKFGCIGVVGSASSRDDDGIDESDSENGGVDGVGWMGQIISIYPYVHLISYLGFHQTHGANSW